MFGMYTSYNRLIMGTLLILSLIILLVAFTAELVFGIQPCLLCVYQRIPYFAVILFIVIAFNVETADFAGILKAIGIIFLISALLALYHNGIQQGWWELKIGCSSMHGIPKNFESFQASLLTSMPERCDSVNWKLFGMSMTVYNFFASTILAMISFIGSKLHKNMHYMN